MRTVVVIGTRPEAIKMAPVIKQLKSLSSRKLQTFVVSTGQHQDMMRPILEFFQINPDFDLGVMPKCGSINSLFSTVVKEMDGLLARIEPDIVLVHGDTTSAAASALAAFHQKTRIGHVEAGLRTGRLDAPFPEEANRRIIGQLADLHFAPTQTAQSQLIAEGVPRSRIVVTGNTVVDALQFVLARLRNEPLLRKRLDERFNFLAPHQHIILVTGHRRENLGNGIDRICDALARLAQSANCAIVYPVHLNPRVQKPVLKRLSGMPRVYLVPPLDYVEFVYLMLRSTVILTDSGGVQEEAPSLGKPVLVMRDVTERPEAVASGLARLVGTEPEKIVGAVQEIIREGNVCSGSPVRNPFGDGRAAERIVGAILGAWQSPIWERRTGDGESIAESADKLFDHALVNTLHSAERERRVAH
nr:MAG: UDP-N-acetylglucosamine 2-epimerase (non-hydrolyzing) [Pseudomonadota bacterium]